MTDATFDIESLVHLEQIFYDAGYEDGFAHGRIHGLIEGRALGRQKGFEMWEELGLYEGFALTWQAIYSTNNQASTTNDRILHHIKHLLDLIYQFPRVNPSPSDEPQSAEMDIEKLFHQIRSRYKVLCSALGVRPSLRASTGSLSLRGESTLKQGSLSPRQRVWTLEDGPKSLSHQNLSF